MAHLAVASFPLHFCSSQLDLHGLIICTANYFRLTQTFVECRRSIFSDNYLNISPSYKKTKKKKILKIWEIPRERWRKVLKNWICFIPSSPVFIVKRVFGWGEGKESGRESHLTLPDSMCQRLRKVVNGLKWSFPTGYTSMTCSAVQWVAEFWPGLGDSRHATISWEREGKIDRDWVKYPAVEVDAVTLKGYSSCVNENKIVHFQCLISINVLIFLIFIAFFQFTFTRINTWLILSPNKSFCWIWVFPFLLNFK